MELKVILHIDDLEHSKEVVQRIVNENLHKKLDWYLKKFDWKDDVEWTLELKVKTNKKNLFNWVLQMKIDWKSYRFEREDYKKLDDLINHLFDHLKEEFSSKK